MSNFKYSMYLTFKNFDIGSSFARALDDFGYKNVGGRRNYDQDSIWTCGILGGLGYGYGVFSQTKSKRDFIFNIDNKWEYEAALAIAAIRDDNKPYVGEYVVSKNKNSYLEGKGLCKIIEVMKDSICFRANIMAVSSLEIACRKATPEEIIAYMKEKYMFYGAAAFEQRHGRSLIEPPTLPEKWAIKGPIWVSNDLLEFFRKEIDSKTQGGSGLYYHFDKSKKSIHDCTDQLLRFGYTEITYKQWKQWYDQQTKEETMKDKKIIGYKLIKQYPDSGFWLNEEVKWTANNLYWFIKDESDNFVKNPQDFPEFWQPIYEEEIKEKVLIIGSQNVKVTISKGSIRFDNNSISISTVRTFYNILNGEQPFDILSGLKLKLNLDPRTRYIEYGCTNLSLEEIKQVIDTYNELNN